MNSNISLKEMGRLLESAEKTLIFTHVNPDGDAVGSSAALCSFLRGRGKEAWGIVDEDIPQYLDFINGEYFTGDKKVIEEPDLCICLDCSEESRILGREAIYNSGISRICIDHHLTGEQRDMSEFADKYYIDSSAAATAQIVYRMFEEMEADIGKDAAEALYTGIVTDTGCFQYSNTTPEVHNIAAKLMEAGIDHMKIMVAVYQNMSLEKLRIQNSIIDTLEVFCGGKAAMVYVTGKMLEDAGASIDDAEGAVDTVRNISGVEIAVFLKEKDDSVKVSMRAKSYGRVDKIAAKFGGGGHMKAAGCTFNASIKEAAEFLKKEIEEYLEN